MIRTPDLVIHFIHHPRKFRGSNFKLNYIKELNINRLLTSTKSVKFLRI